MRKSRVPVRFTGQHFTIDMKKRYLGFLCFMLQQPDLPVQLALKKLFRKKQVGKIAGTYGISLHRPAKHLSAKQWSGCFREMLANVPERFHPH